MLRNPTNAEKKAIAHVRDRAKTAAAVAAAINARLGNVVVYVAATANRTAPSR
jgi:hypothetical protein